MVLRDLEFSAGEAAVKAVQTNDDLLKESSVVFKVTSEQLPKTCDRFFNEWKAFKNEIERLKDEIARLKIGELSDYAVNIGEYEGIIPSGGGRHKRTC
jgi:alanyl-tRNA synthetase